MVYPQGLLFEPNPNVLQNGQQLSGQTVLNSLLAAAVFLYTDLARKRSKPKIRSEYDYVIVGGGVAGSVLASRLSEDPQVNVLLIERGGSSSIYSDIPRLYGQFFSTSNPLIRILRTVPQENLCRFSPTHQCRIYTPNVLGGGSSINEMNYVRGNRLDYDDWATNGARNWSYEAMLPYFLRLENNPELTGPYHARGGPISVTSQGWSGLDDLKRRSLEAAQELELPVGDYNGERQAVFSLPQDNIIEGVRQSTDRCYLQPVESRENLDIILFSQATRIIFEHRRAIGVEFRQGSQLYQVSTRREVIVSAGPMGSAQLLLLSGVGPATDIANLQIPVVADLPVGQGLQDHVVCNINFTTSALFPNDGIIDEKSLDAWRQQGQGPLNSQTIALGFLRTSSSTTDDDVQGEYALKYEATADQRTHGQKQFLIQILSWVVKPRSRGTVRLETKDPLDLPLIDPRWLDNQIDRDNALELLEGALKLMQTKPFRAIDATPVEPSLPRCAKYEPWSRTYLECYIRYVCTGSAHYASTNRMGSRKDPTAVVDERLRVIGLKGLRVADSSIMPSVTRGNTMIPTVAIGEKAADLIRDDWARN